MNKFYKSALLLNLLFTITFLLQVTYSFAVSKPTKLYTSKENSRWESSYDLALRKTLVETGNIYVGDAIHFRIEIFNQGTEIATQIRIVDYLPVGLTLQDTLWNVRNDKAYLTIDSLRPGSSKSILVKFLVNSNAKDVLVNAAEIASFKGNQGQDVEDADSLPDDNPNNDGTPIDSEIDQQATEGGDEDDHDIAPVNITLSSSISGNVRLGMNGLAGTQILLLEEGLVQDSATTDKTGTFLFKSLQTGTYNLEAHLSNGFKIKESVKFNDTTRLTEPFELSLGENLSGFDLILEKVSCTDSLLLRLPTSIVCSGTEFGVHAEFLSKGNVAWYTSSNATVPEKVTQHGETAIFKLNTSTQYFVESSVKLEGCTAQRIPVLLAVNPQPSKPSVIADTKICTDSLVKLYNLLTTPPDEANYNFKIYTDSLRTTPADSSVGVGEYYAFQESAIGCASTYSLMTVTKKECGRDSIQVNLSLVKSADKRSVALNDTVVYTITIRNSSEHEGTNIEVQDILPQGLTFISGSGINVSGDTLLASIPLIPGSSERSVSYAAKATKSGNIVNFAEIVKADQADPNSTPGNGVDKNEDDDDDEVIVVSPPDTVQLADLSIIKTANRSLVSIGEHVIYTITVANEGPNTATGVVVRDSLRKGASFIKTIGGQNLQVSNGMILASFSEILAGSSANFSVEVKLDSAGQYLNIAEIWASDQKDPDSTPQQGEDEDDTSSVSIMVLDNCELPTPMVSTNRSYICAGETITLVAVGCTNFVWSNGQTGSSISVSPVVNTTYNAYCTTGTCKGQASNTLAVGVTGSTNLTINASKKTICVGEEITLSAQGCTGTVTWSNGSTGNTILVDPSETTTYTATCQTVGCSGSGSITVAVNDVLPASPEAASFVRNECPQNFVNLNKTITAVPPNTTLVFKNGNNSASADSDSLIYTKGLFFAYALSPNGCYSKPTAITVDIEVCDSTARSNLAINLVADNNKITSGDTVLLTAVVKNLGSVDASNIKLVSLLGTNVVLVPVSSGLSTIGNRFEHTIANLKSGQSDTLYYKLKLNTVGVYTHNIALTAVTPVDTSLHNNLATIDIEVVADTASCLASSLAGAVQSLEGGLYEVNLTTYLQNCGQDHLEQLSLTLGLSAFSEADSNITNLEVITSSNSLILAQAYDGFTNKEVLAPTSILPGGEKDSVIIRFTLKTSQNLVTLQALVSALDSSGSRISDSTNTGINPIRGLSSLTALSFIESIKSPILANLTVKEIQLGANKTSRITFRSLLKNATDSTMNQVSIIDSLSKYFETPAIFYVENVNILNANSGLVLNPVFDGRENASLTLPTSSLAAGHTDTLEFTLVLSKVNRLNYENQLNITAAGNIQKYSHKDPDITVVGSDPTPVFIHPDAIDIIQENCVGLALIASEKIWESDGTLTVNYISVIGNCGQKPLTGISLCDSLANGLPAGSMVKIIGVPTLNTGSKLVLDSNFAGTDGKTCLLNPALSVLDSGKIDTIKYSLNISSYGGIYSKQLELSAEGITNPEKSNDGIQPFFEGEIPTIVVLDSTFNQPALGLAKKLEKITKEGDNFLLDFSFYLKNYSAQPITMVQLTDDLENVFGSSVDVRQANITAIPEGLQANSHYTGKGENTAILIDSLSNIPAFSTKKVGIRAEIVLNSQNKLLFENFGLVIGAPRGSTVSIEDTSTDGFNPDKNGSGSPTDDSEPTLIDLRPFFPVGEIVSLGIAKAGLAELSSTGATRITYKVVVKNYGGDILKNVLLEDNLRRVFDNNTEFTLLELPTVNQGSLLEPNSQFNGISDINLLSEGSVLEVGKQDTVTFVVSAFNTNTEAQTYRNQVLGRATENDIEIEDLSVSGEDPDADGDGNPGNDSGYTINIIDPGVIDTAKVNLRISEGISPNGDGINDVFVISDENNVMPIEDFGIINVIIVNRWGHVVYKSDDYAKDLKEGRGWGGNANTGVIWSKASGLPTGTYYYSIQSANPHIFGGNAIKGYVTLKR